MNKTKWIWVTVVIGGLAGGLGTAQLIDVLKPYTVLLGAGGTFLGIVVAFLVNKANTKKEA